MQYSIIIPLYNEENNFNELYQRVQKTLSGTGASYEIIFVDDGSKDSTADLIFQLAKDNHHILGIKFSRNFGQENAVLAGIKCCRGNAIVIMDGDLQDPPEFVSDLIEEKNKGYSVVYGIKSNRKENFIKRGLTSIFYQLLRFLSKVELPRNVGIFSIFSRNVAWNIITLKENNKFIAGLRSYVGFKQKGVPYNREKRTMGESKSYFSLLRMGLNAIFSFSILPLRITMLLTLVMGTLTIIILFALAFQHFQNAFSGWDMTDSIIFFLLIQIFLMLSALTIVCEYIGRIHEQIKRRPDYIIESIIIGGQIVDDIDNLKSIENSLLKA